jgi:predicted transcriptional regulator
MTTNKYYGEIPDNVVIDHLKDILSDGLVVYMNESKDNGHDLITKDLLNVLKAWLNNKKFYSVIYNSYYTYNLFTKDVIKLVNLKLSTL